MGLLCYVVYCFRVDVGDLLKAVSKHIFSGPLSCKRASEWFLVKDTHSVGLKQLCLLFFP